MPRWAKGETKHILMNDNCNVTVAASSGVAAVTAVDATALTTVATDGLIPHNSESQQSIGEMRFWSLNPCLQNNSITGRNGRQIDGTYLRIQGHVRNNNSNGTDGKAYVRMMVLAVKGNRPNGGLATINQSDLFKKIDGSVVGYVEPAGVSVKVLLLLELCNYQ